MPEPRLCPTCLAWFLADDDAWCGNCRAPSARFRFTLQPDVLQIKNVAPPLNGSLTNLSCADLTLERTGLPDWITFSQLPASLPAGATTQFTARAQTFGIASPQSGSVSIQTSAGPATTELLIIEENPSLQTQPAEIELWGSGIRSVPITVGPATGALRLRSITRGSVGDLTPAAALSGVVTVTAAQPLPVALQIDVDRLRANPAGSLRIVYDGPFGPRETELQLKFLLRDPPQLRWTGENAAPAELFASTGQRLVLTLSNQAPDGREAGARNARLTIKSVQLTPSHATPDFPLRLLTALPLTLRGGESTSLTFELDLDTFAQPGPRNLRLALRVDTDSLSFERPVSIAVRQLPIFDGVLAIDFGSSNTCAAIVETGREQQTLPLDGNDDISPTLLRYDDLRGPAAQVETGARIARLAVIDDRSAASTIGALKQRLGDVRQDIPLRPMNAEDWTSRTATDAAADYLREMRRIVEARQRTTFRDFILTHPATCSLRQYRNLRSALTSAFGDSGARIRFLQEPIAALIPFFAERATAPTRRPVYTVASFDVGGGTTDLAIVRVEHIPVGPGRIEIRPNVLFSRGIRFGGEDLTDFLIAHMISALAEILSRARPGASLIVGDTTGASIEDVLRNGFALRSAAEQFKSRISDEWKATPEPAWTDSIPLTVRILPAGQLVAEDFNVPFKDVASANGAGMKALFLTHVQQHFGLIANLLADAETRLGRLDFIQLSGKTAYLSAIGDLLRARFPSANVSRASNPKECVVSGACLSRAMSTRPSQRLVLPDASTRTTSSIGLYDPVAAEFTPLIPVDTPIPAEGLTAGFARAWFGSEPVVLWENLGVSDLELRASRGGSRLLSRLGTWRPQASQPDAEANGWDLQVVLRNFEVEVSALGPEGQTMRFAPLDDNGTGARP